MTERGEFERILRAAYAARKRGDVDAILQIFAEDARFELAGAYTASPIAVRTTGARDLRSVLTVLIGTFEWLDQDIKAIVIEGNRAAVHWRGRIRSTLTGETVETELVDLVELRGGRIASFIEFCDTALAARLMAH
jgi:ketosteroid isomerase-like protein